MGNGFMSDIPYPIRGYWVWVKNQTQSREMTAQRLLLRARAQAGQHPLAGGKGGPPAARPSGRPGRKSERDREREVVTERERKTER